MTPLPGKGGGSLAQAFLDNTATQPTQALPEIQQPVQRPMPSIGSLAPLMPPQQPTQQRSEMPPGFEKAYPNNPDQPNLWRAPDGWLYDTKNNTWSWPEMGGSDIMGGQFGNTSAYAPDVRMWLSGMGGPQQQQTEQPAQPSQAQLLARAMNQAALRRG